MTLRDLAESPDARARGASEGESSSVKAPYRSLFVLGRGGMGSVEAALSPLDEDDDTSRRQRVVALKRLLPDAARDRRRAEMFLREARLAAMLDHPNVVRAYDYGEIDGELYLAMEYVEGQPLSRVLSALEAAGERMPPAVAAWLLAEACRGLHAAHELADPSTGEPLHLVHRDVSPQNVMLDYDGRVRLLDFGVAKIASENVTKTGEVKGKTAYMSPEQAMGDPLDRRSDLFGVGAVLFECLALRRMWGSGTDMDVLRKLALEAPPSLDACGVELPEGLASLHARLVARDAKDRPATALDVATQLARFVDDAEAARRDLGAILDAHFAEQASEQRARLVASLREVVPGEADDLRDSLLPARSRTPPRPAVATVTTPRPHASGRSTKLAALLALALVASLLAWRLTSRAPIASDDDVGRPTAQTRAPTPASASLPAPVETLPSPHPDTPRSAATASPIASPPAPTRAPGPTGAAAPPRATAAAPSAQRPATATATPSSPSIPPTARPTPPTPRPSPPPDLDEKPF
ncbi:MAG: protein kinase [Labilithrix sp.]|nr:protein kinase [Labilithrix sp.]